MKKMILILALMLSTTGCALFAEKKDPAERKYIENKQKLEREVELLRLERRKILLQNSLDRLDAMPLPGEKIPKPAK